MPYGNIFGDFFRLNELSEWEFPSPSILFDKVQRIVHHVVLVRHHNRSVTRKGQTKYRKTSGFQAAADRANFLD
jgi:hypothetical protein